MEPRATRFTFRTARQVPRLGVMLVGWGGNNGSTLTAAVLANRLRLTWPTRTGRKEANYYGSLTLELASQRHVFVGGDDFKSGQTKVKSVLVDFLIGSGLKTMSIVSYNHLGNNDGQNLSAPLQFRSKEVTKSSVVDDMVHSNHVLYAPGERPDHCVVIKYVPYVGDSKRALDEYTSELMLGGTNTLVLHNTCEDSLLAAPIMLDLVLLTELCQRVSFCTDSDPEPQGFHTVLSLLSFLFKAPLVPPGSPVVNALFRQRSCIENIFRACVGLPPQNHMLLEHKMERPGPGIKPGEVVATSPLPCKKEPTPATNGCTGDANGHPQAPTPKLSTA